MMDGMPSKIEVKQAINAAFSGRPVDSRGGLEREITNFISQRWPTIELVSCTWDKGDFNVVIRQVPRFEAVHIDIEDISVSADPPDES
jgi:hypothetical protein